MRGGSARLQDALVARGAGRGAVARVQEHRDAGATHVCVQVLADDPFGRAARGLAAAGGRAAVSGGRASSARYRELEQRGRSPLRTRVSARPGRAAAGPAAVAVLLAGGDLRGRPAPAADAARARRGPWTEATVFGDCPHRPRRCRCGRCAATRGPAGARPAVPAPRRPAACPAAHGSCPAPSSTTRLLAARAGRGRVVEADR